MENLNFFKYSLDIFKFLRLWNKRVNQEKSRLATISLYTMIVINGSIIPLICISDILRSARTVEVPVLLCKALFGLAYPVCIYKLISVTIYKNEIYGCITQIEALSFRFQVQKDIKQSLETYKKMIFIGSIAMNFCVLLVLVVSILNNELPFRSRLSVLDLNQSPTYELMFFYQAIALTTVANLTVAHDTLFCGLLSICAAILSSISREVREIDSRWENGGNPEIILKEIIEKIKETFCSNQMALSVYLVSVWGLKDLTGMLMVIIALIQTFDLWIYCYFGQIIANQNEKLQRELYCTNWYNHSKQFKSMLLLTIFVTQNDRFVKAGRIIALSLATFSDFLKKAYVLYTFLTEVR
ncbi:odorant receptor 82a-like isoform X2 [Eupeodes corollae]|uniref:odorant receptor 82a-like isoform X2 n=1 Tax=Eupeodes corollae TaxID=290404 RepID=UPI002491A88F|nr:odorant receptor 82a-like isoform X2 [Eupeodes corollae]